MHCGIQNGWHHERHGMGRATDRVTKGFSYTPGKTWLRTLIFLDNRGLQLPTTKALRDRGPIPR